MKGMKGDMAGAGAALGAAIALKRLGALPDGLPPHLADRPLECYLAITDNLIGPKAFRPDDVHVACDGTTIEMVHTDAEGRLALADTLALASRKVNWPCAPPSDGETDAEAAVLPALVIDMATLTGTMVTALSKRYSGVFSSRMHSHPATMGAIVAAGVASGERLWPFPLDADYADGLKSDVADTLQCTVSSEADHILAAAFLRKFVREDVPWLHIDLAGPAAAGGLAHVSGDARGDFTGFGVRAAVWAVCDQWEDLAGEA